METVTPDQLRELISRMPTDERISALYGIAPKLLALWEATIRKAEDGPIGPPYDIDLALTALEEQA